MAAYEIETRTGKGRRESNQDKSFARTIDDKRALLVVCDGMGGHAHGEAASELAIRTTRTFFMSYYLKDSEKNYCHQLIRDIEETFTAYINEKHSYKGMGTTIAMVYLNGTDACCVWVGDSRIYHFRGNKILFESEDHNLGTLLVNSGLIGPDSIEYRSQRQILTQCIQGSHKPAEFSFQKIENLKKGDRILVCSDGVTDTLEDIEIQSLVQAPTLKRAADSIEMECIERSEDNFSVILAEI